MLWCFKGQFPTGAAHLFLVPWWWPWPGSIQVLWRWGACEERRPGQWWNESGGRALRSIACAVFCARGSPSSCPRPAEIFHCPTPSCSERAASLRRFWRQRLKLGLEHFAVTDHHSSQALAPMRRHLDRLVRLERPSPSLGSGRREIKSCCWKGCLGGNVLGLGFDPGPCGARSLTWLAARVGWRGPAGRCGWSKRIQRHRPVWLCWPTPPAIAALTAVIVPCC